MQKKLTITLARHASDGPNVLGKDLEVGYREMAREEAPETEAVDWVEALVGDAADEAAVPN